MLLTHVLKAACPRCQTIGRYGRVHVVRDVLLRGCNACGLKEHVPLPSLRKRVIYLDQHFLSHAFRQGAQPFVDAAKRLESLAGKQLIVSPWSEVHEVESHIWRDTRATALWEFIKQTARGHQFRTAEHIKRCQLGRLMESFLKEQPPAVSVERSDALDRDVDSWDNYLWVDVGRFAADPDQVRASKEKSAASLATAMDTWRRQPQSFEADVLQEATGYARGLWQVYWDWVKAMATGDIDGALHSPDDALVAQQIMAERSRDEAPEARIRRAAGFLGSEHFRAAPYVDICSRLFAVLRKVARAGRGSGGLAGLPYDFQAVTLFGPYTDAIFVDRELRRWLLDPEADLVVRYGLRVFSADVWDEFHAYLDEIESDAVELQPLLGTVYG